MKLLLLVNVAALMVALGTALVVAWTNRGSSNVVLAVGALVGATGLYGVQLFLELSRTVVQDHVTSDLTIDRQERSIRQWKYPDPTASSRLGWEVPLGRWLGQVSPDAFDGDRERITRDFAVRSLLAFLSSPEYGWLQKRKVFVGSTGKLSHTTGTAGPSTVIGPEVLQGALRKAGNLFAEPPFTPAYAVRLPPNSVMDLSENTLTITNPICQIRFHVEIPGAVTYTQPNTGGEVPTIPSGDARYETRYIGITIDRTFFAHIAHVMP